MLPFAFMADCAVADCYRTVDVFVFAHVAMTFSAHAGVLGGISAPAETRYGQERDETCQKNLADKFLFPGNYE